MGTRAGVFKPVPVSCQNRSTVSVFTPTTLLQTLKLASRVEVMDHFRDKRDIRVTLRSSTRSLVSRAACRLIITGSTSKKLAKTSRVICSSTRMRNGICLSASVLNRWLRVYVDVLNLTNEPFRRFEGFKNRPVQEEYYRWWLTAG